ncbi:unnamed protein product [Linum tenue]|uniref:CCHC-type domain-containing protein n=1 Tax=Linum tenue TaxID=586396 RepID=A0AAV0LII1_9ROSI|nr:unnamed protein product [Linum tenue]
MTVWVQLPAFPLHFYHREVLFSVGNMIGRTIKLDYHTLHQQREKFDRIAVEVDLSKPLVTRIRLDGAWQYLEYENLSVLCFECGKIVHTKESCPTLNRRPLSSEWWNSENRRSRRRQARRRRRRSISSHGW